MARIKFNTQEDQFNGSIFGQTFYSGSKVSTIRNIAPGKRSMSEAQRLMSSYLILADRHWKHLTDYQRGQWNLFASLYPQRSNASALVFLSGYELFVKRNQHYQIFADHNPRFMLVPNFVQYLIDQPTVAIYSSPGKLEIELTFSRSASDLDCFFTLSAPISNSKYFKPSARRLILVCKNVTQVIDITSKYVSIFGRLPNPAQVLNFNMFQAGADNGQYFFPLPVNVVVLQGPAPTITPVKYGLLYNFYAVTNVANIASSGWRAPSRTDLNTLNTYLGGTTLAGAKLKETGLTYWLTPNTGATNSSLFNGRGAGYRDHGAGSFLNLKSTLYLYSSTAADPTLIWSRSLTYNTTNFQEIIPHPRRGQSLRLVKIATTLTNGQTGEYTGNDGKRYRTICVGSQEWLADDLCETKYRTGTLIPVVTANGSWAALSTGACCAYDNDWSNVLL